MRLLCIAMRLLHRFILPWAVLDVISGVFYYILKSSLLCRSWAQELGLLMLLLRLELKQPKSASAAERHDLFCFNLAHVLGDSVAACNLFRGGWRGGRWDGARDIIISETWRVQGRFESAAGCLSITVECESVGDLSGFIKALKCLQALWHCLICPTNGSEAGFVIAIDVAKSFKRICSSTRLCKLIHFQISKVCTTATGSRNQIQILLCLLFISTPQG